MNDKLKLNALGLHILRHFETFESRVYLDPGKVPTIGYGHVVLSHERHLTTREITHAEGTQLLLADVAIAEDAVRRLVKRSLNENQFSALVSFVFNIGETQFKASTLLRYLNANTTFAGVSGQFERWVFQKSASRDPLPGLVKRRAVERWLFCLPATSAPDEPVQYVAPQVALTVEAGTLDANTRAKLADVPDGGLLILVQPTVADGAAPAPVA